jgi:flagellar protein FliO/FliZ
MTGNAVVSVLWFIAILAMIPLALWLLKRTPAVRGAGAATGVMRHVATLPLAPNQRLVTVEVGAGEDRKWLVLGVTPQSINTLHTMAPQGELVAGVPAEAPPFAQLLNRLREGHRRDR